MELHHQGNARQEIQLGWASGGAIDSLQTCWNRVIEACNWECV